MTPPEPRVPGAALALAALAAALAVALTQHLVGIRLTGEGATYDGAFAVAALHGFREALAAGDWFPGWIPSSNGGLGSPIFWFYPPGSYYLAAAMALLPGPSPSDADAIGRASVLIQLIGAIACAAWLRRWAGLPAALTGGAAYALMPYISFVVPQIMGGYAQMAATALLPLLFLAIDAGRGQTARTMALAAPAMALITFTHLPMAVMAGGLAIAYAALAPATIGAMLRGGLAATAAVLTGLALAGVTLLPALLLQPATNMARAEVPLDTIDYLFSPTKILAMGWPRMIAVSHFAVLAPLAAAAIGWWATRGLQTPGQRGMLRTLALALFLITPLSRPLWEHMPFLARIQFPIRFVVPLSLLAAGVFALGLARMPQARARLLVFALIAWAAALLPLIIYVGDRFRPGDVRTAEARAEPWSNVPMYLPSTSLAHDWESLRLRGPAAMQAEAARLSGCTARNALPLTHAARSITVDVRGCEGPTLLPHFHFPGWAWPAGPVAADPATGLIRLDLPPGTTEVTIHRVAVPEQRPAAIASLTALALWLAAAARALRRRQPPLNTT